MPESALNGLAEKYSKTASSACLGAIKVGRREPGRGYVRCAYNQVDARIFCNENYLGHGVPGRSDGAIAADNETHDKLPGLVAMQFFCSEMEKDTAVVMLRAFVTDVHALE